VNETLQGEDVRASEMPASPVSRIPSIYHLQAVRTVEKIGFQVVREGKHNVMSDGTLFLRIP
jgi:hypothetical protein